MATEFPSRSASILIRGARQHNLRGIDVQLPRGALTVVTGVSGSGKSSLAMDTLYAEGQRRYLDSVSTHGRRFLERMTRPDVDAVEGLSPAVAVTSRGASRSARSTVGTATEVHDFLRLLFARAGTVHCPRCREDVPDLGLEDVIVRWAGSGSARLLITFPHAAGDTERSDLASRGYRRGVVAGEVRELEGAPTEGSWDVLQDRLRGRNRERLAEALEAAFREGTGEAAVHEEGSPPVRYVLGRVCPRCRERYPVPEPAHFSFNHALGACATCRGFGDVLTFDPGLIVPDPDRTLAEGAIEPWAGRWRTWFLRKRQSSPRARRIPRDVPWRELDAEDQELLLHGDRTFPGALPFLRKLTRKSYRAGARFLVKRYQRQVPCGDCGGSRLGPAGRRVVLDGEAFPGWLRLPVESLRSRLERLSLPPSHRPRVETVLDEILHRLRVLERVGLGYLDLARPTRTLSGGEAGRIELAQALGARLVDTLYVLDEPTVGLHPRDTERLLGVLRDLLAGGNSVVVVEHDEDVMAAADWMIDLGPGAGRDGGNAVYCGSAAERIEGDWSPTRDLLDRRDPAPRPSLTDPRGWIRIRRSRLHNLKDLDVDLPWPLLVGVCGVSGSGKSSLVDGTLVPLLGRSFGPAGSPSATVRDPELGDLVREAPLESVSVVDQNLPGRSARSIPASYVGAWNGIRECFARLPDSKRLGFGPGTFSFNKAGGRCETCKGEGELTVDMDFMADLRLRCDRCDGKRFDPETLLPRFRGHSVVDVLELTVDDARRVFRGVPRVERPLAWLHEVGLGYLVLGQPATTLSGGEAQRLKLVRELARGGGASLLVLDEPTVGLHASEVARLVGILRRLCEAGNGVVVVEHNLDVLAACDWLVELGPEGGEGGGRLIAEGPPEVVARTADSRIAPYLSPRLRAGRRTERDPLAV